MFKLVKATSQKAYPYYYPIDEELQHKTRGFHRKQKLRDMEINERNNKNRSLFQKKSQGQDYTRLKFKQLEKDRISKNTKYYMEEKYFQYQNQNSKKRQFKKLFNSDYLNYIVQKNDKKHEQLVTIKRVMPQMLKSNNCKAAKYKAGVNLIDYRNIIITQKSNTILGSSYEHSLINHRSLIKQSEIKYHKSNSSHIGQYVESSSDSDHDQSQLKDQVKKIEVSYDQNQKMKKKKINFKQKCNYLISKIEPAQINHNDILAITLSSIDRQNKQVMKRRYRPKFNNHRKHTILNTQSLIQYQSPQNQLR